MRTEKKEIKFPENLPLRDKLKETGRSLQWYAAQIGVSRNIVSNTVNGHYKGINVIPKLQELLNQ